MIQERGESIKRIDQFKIKFFYLLALHSITLQRYLLELRKRMYNMLKHTNKIYLVFLLNISHIPFQGRRDLFIIILHLLPVPTLVGRIIIV